MDSKHIKVDKNQQMEKFKKKSPHLAVCMLLTNNVLLRSAWFCQNTYVAGGGKYNIMSVRK